MAKTAVLLSQGKGKSQELEFARIGRQVAEKEGCGKAGGPEDRGVEVDTASDY